MPREAITDDMARALLDVIRESVRFANWAAGQGIAPVEGEPAGDPEDFIMAFCGHLEGEEIDDIPGTIMRRLAGMEAAARRKALTEAAYIVSAFGGEQSGAIREAIMNARDKG